MPIIVTHGDQAAFGQGAYESGRGISRARRNERQRDRDARFVENRMAARERITAIETQNNYANQRQSTGPARVIQQYRQDRQLRNDQSAMEQARVSAEQEAENNDRSNILAGLDSAYEGREKDIQYFLARDMIGRGEKLPDRLMSSIGVETASEKMAKAKQEAELQDGQIDVYEPKNDRERLIQRTLQQGRPGDIAGMLDKRDKPTSVFDETPSLSLEAMAARTQLEGFAAMTSDKALLEKTREELKEKGVSDEAIQALEDRIIELDTEEMQVKAPAAFEQAVSSFQAKLNAVQKAEGRALDTTERRKLLASTITTTAKSYGISIELLGEYIRANDENRRMAEQLVQKAQDAIASMAPPPGAMTGVEQQFGPNNPSQSQPNAEPGAMPELRDFNTPRTTR